MELSEDMWKSVKEVESHQYDVRLTEEILYDNEELETATGTEIEIALFNHTMLTFMTFSEVSVTPFL